MNHPNINDMAHAEEQASLKAQDENERLHKINADLLVALERIAVRAENDNQLWIADEARAAITAATS